MKDVFIKFAEKQKQEADSLRKAVEAQRSLWEEQINEGMDRAIVDKGIAFIDEVCNKSISLNRKIGDFVPLLDRIDSAGDVNMDDIHIVIHRALEIEALYSQMGTCIDFFVSLDSYRKNCWQEPVVIILENVGKLIEIIGKDAE